MRRRVLLPVPLLALLVLFGSLPATAQDPRAVVVDFYRPYQATGMVNLREHTRLHQAMFEAELGSMLAEISANQPGDDRPWLDFDPYLNGQMNAASMTLGQASVRGNLAWVPVGVSYRVPGHEVAAAKVYLRRIGGDWRIANFVYPARDGAPSWDLRSWLHRTLKR